MKDSSQHSRFWLNNFRGTSFLWTFTMLPPLCKAWWFLRNTYWLSFQYFILDGIEMNAKHCRRWNSYLSVMLIPWSMVTFWNKCWYDIEKWIPRRHWMTTQDHCECFYSWENDVSVDNSVIGCLALRKLSQKKHVTRSLFVSSCVDANVFIC